MPSSKDGYFCTHSGQKMLHFRDKDIPEKNHDLLLKNATKEILWNPRNPVFMRVSAIYRKGMWQKWQNEEKFCHTRKPLFYRAERGFWHKRHNFLSQL